jgi:virginiamycin A acetyltransferase
MLNPHLRYLPSKLPDGSWGEYKNCIFLKHFITKTDIIDGGDYTYYAATGNECEDASLFEQKNVLYAFPGSRLEIGKFCQLAQDCKFMLHFADHHLNAFTTYPLFWNLLDQHDNYFEAVPSPKYFKEKGKTVIGNDVWIGYDALIMPGVNVGNGAIVGARSVVTKDIPPYCIVAGNPAKIIRYRFEESVIEKLCTIAWWNWDIAKIMKHYDAIMNCNIDVLMGAF